MDLPGNPIPRVIRRLLFVLAPRHTAPACRSIERFKREQPELMTFLLQEYPKLANAPDPCFERALERLKEACSCFSLVQLADFMACPQDEARRILAGRRNGRPADAMLRDVAGISPPTSDSPADCIRRVRQKRNSHSRNMAAPTPSYRR